MSSTEVFDSLRLTQAEVEHLMSELNRASAASPMVSRRTLKRWPMRFQRSVLTTTSKLMGNMHGVAYPRNLAKRGAAVLSGAFVHPGTTCHLTLRSLDGKARSLAGVVRWCRHVKARAHDLGVEFGAPINPREFCIEQAGECLFEMERVDVTSLKGLLIVVDEDRLTHRLFQDILGTSSVELVFAQSGDAGLKLLDQSPALIVAEHTLPDMNGLDFLKKVREAGFRTPLVLMAREGNDELRLAAIAAGAQELLLRPLTPDTILRGAAEYLSDATAAKGSKAGDHARGEAEATASAPPVEELIEMANKSLALAGGGDVEGAKALLTRIATTAREFNLISQAEHSERAAGAAVGSTAPPRLLAEVQALLRSFEETAPKPAAAAAGSAH